MGSVNSKVSEDEAYLDLTGSCSGLSLACARLHLSSWQVQEDDHSRSWRVCRLLHPGCRLLRQERQVCRQVQESKESQVRVELFVLCVHLDCEELQHSYDRVQHGHDSHFKDRQARPGAW